MKWHIYCSFVIFCSSVFFRLLNKRAKDPATSERRYTVDLKQLPEYLAQKFMLSHEDQETLDFITQSREKSDWILTQVWHGLAKSFLTWFMTNTSINGSQFLKLLNEPETYRSSRLLDIGAGDGTVTSRMSIFYKKTFVTEISKTMRWRLEKRNYTVLDLESWDKQQYSLISCLNVLDRCEQPLQLLRRMRDALLPNGRLLLALVLPFSVYVESTSNHQAKETLAIAGETHEAQLTSFVNDVITPAGFDLIRFTKLPYLCEGDLESSYYYLNDYVFVLKRKL